MGKTDTAAPEDRTGVSVYIPKPGTAIGRTVERASAIVAPKREFRTARTTVYYEDLSQDAEGLVTFADRAMLAYRRMRAGTSTPEGITALPQELARVGTLDPARGVISAEREALRDLLNWLGIPDVPGDRRTLTLQRELCVHSLRQ
jgi:hypothetical protein